MVLQSPLQKFLILVYQTVECSHYYFPTTADNIHKSISQKISQQSAETLWPTITMTPCSIVTQEMEKVLFLRTFKISKVTAQITTGQQDNLSFLWHKQSLQLYTLIYPLWLACLILNHLTCLSYTNPSVWLACPVQWQERWARHNCGCCRGLWTPGPHPEVKEMTSLLIHLFTSLKGNRTSSLLPEKVSRVKGLQELWLHSIQSC